MVQLKTNIIMVKRKYDVSVHFNIPKTIEVVATSKEEAEKLALRIAECQFDDLNLYDFCDDNVVVTAKAKG